MNRIQALFWVPLVLICNQAISAPWPNEPAGSTQVLDCPFSGSVCGMWDVYKSAAFVTDATSPEGGTNQVLDNFLPANGIYGNGTWNFTLPQNQNGSYPKEIYFGVWWKTNADFQGNPAGGNKMIFANNDYHNNYLTWYGPVGQPKTLEWVNQSIVNNCDVPGWVGECGNGADYTGTGAFTPNMGAGGIYAAGSGWHRIEIYQRSSTTMTSKDGILRMWVDDVLIADYPHINQIPNGFRTVDINTTWDGSGSTTQNRDYTKSWHHYYDHLRVSIPNCGAGGCPVKPYLVIDGTLLPGRSGTPYSATLTARGGKAPFNWFLASGNLPAGLMLNQNTGVISGTPTCAGRSDFTIRVIDASSPALSSTKSYSIITSGTSTSCPPTSSVTTANMETEQAQFSAEAVGGRMTFKLPAIRGAQYRLCVYDLAGKTVYEHASIGQREISVAKVLKSGVYVARFTQGAQASSYRFSVMN